MTAHTSVSLVVSPLTDFHTLIARAAIERAPEQPEPDSSTSVVPSAKNSLSTTPIRHAELNTPSREEMESRLENIVLAAFAMLASFAALIASFELERVPSAILQGISNAFVFAGIFIIIYDTYVLFTEWAHLSMQKRLMGIGYMMAEVAIFTAEVLNFLKDFSEFAIHFSEQVLEQFALVVQVLGPIAAGVGAIFSAIRAVMSFKKAMDYDSVLKAISDAKLRNNITETKEKSLLELLSAKYTMSRNMALLDSASQFITAIALGAAAFVLAGVVGAALATPLGWVLAGLALVGLIVGVAAFCYRRWCAREYQRKVTEVQKQPSQELTKPEQESFLKKFKEPWIKKMIEEDLRILKEKRAEQNKVNGSKGNGEVDG